MSDRNESPKLFSPSFLAALLAVSILTNIILVVKLKYPGILTKLQLSFIPAPKVLATDHVRGAANAKYTVIEYADYQCPFCAKFHVLMNSLRTSADVRWIYRHFPLPSHPLAAKAAETAECASEQDRFWEYSDAVFALEGRLTDDNLNAAAKKAGLDWVSLGLCLGSGKYREAVKGQYESGMKLKVSGTPTYFINGKRFEGALPAEELKKELGLNPS